MFCRNCGTQMADDSKFCANCGTPVAAPAAPVEPAAPATPVQEAPVQQPVQETPAQPAPAKAPANDAIATVKGILHYIAGGVAVLALIFGIMNLFGLYSVTASYMGMSASGAISDLYEGSTALLIGNILYGLGSLVVAAIGALYFLKKQMNNDLYDKFVAKYTGTYLAKLVDGEGIAALLGAVGGVFGILQLFFFLVADPHGIGASVSMHFTSWVMLIVYVALFCGDMFWLGKKQK